MLIIEISYFGYINLHAISFVLFPQASEPSMNFNIIYNIYDIFPPFPSFSFVFSSRNRFCPICDSGIIEDEFHFLFHCPKYSIPREKFYNQIQQNFVDFNQLSYTELIIKLMNSQNFSVNSHLLKFVSLCNDLRNNLLSNHADDT